MREHFLKLAEELANDPVKQGALAAFCTFILEDPTTVSCGLLVADHRMGFMTAMVGLTAGIVIGDFGLYFIGRFFGPYMIRKKWISQARVDRARILIDDNLLIAVLLSRFLPGTRIPTYVGAGLFGASAMRFLMSSILASAIWTLLLLMLTVHVGEQVLPLLGELKWIILAGAAAIALTVLLIRRQRKKTREANVVEQGEVVSVFEFWHPVLFYLPVGIYYTWLAIRFRSTSLPSAANPSIYSGGICRESKSEILSLVPNQFSRFIARFITYTKNDGESVDALLQRMRIAGLDFPVVAKPDEGQRGAGVRRVVDAKALRAYVEEFPVGVPILIQQLVTMPQEAGVLYYRMPHEKTGQLLSLTLKELPSVTGDGKRTLRQLILADARARLISEVYFRRHAELLDVVGKEGEDYPLVFTGNHCQGAIFRNGTQVMTEELRAAFAAIAEAMPEFYFGRFDVKFRDLDSFLRGENFQIVEINGASAEATHIWDSKMRITDAYKMLFRQFRILFEIGDENRRRGFKPIGGLTILRDFMRYQKTAKKYPPSS